VQLLKSSIYKSYLESSFSVNKNLPEKTQISAIRESVNDLLDILRDKSDIKERNIVISILNIPLIIVLVWSLLQQGVAMWILYITMGLIGYAIVNHLILRRVISDNTDIKWSSAIPGENDRGFLLYKTKFILSAIRIKHTRQRLLQLFYILFFPPLLIALHLLIQGQESTGAIIRYLLITYPVCGFIWYLYFQFYMNEIESIREKVHSYQGYINRMIITDFSEE
jgi:hypothetical protein